MTNLGIIYSNIDMNHVLSGRYLNILGDEFDHRKSEFDKIMTRTVPDLFRNDNSHIRDPDHIVIGVGVDNAMNRDRTHYYFPNFLLDMITSGRKVSHIIFEPRLFNRIQSIRMFGNRVNLGNGGIVDYPIVLDPGLDLGTMVNDRMVEWTGACARRSDIGTNNLTTIGTNNLTTISIPYLPRGESVDGIAMSESFIYSPRRSIIIYSSMYYDGSRNPYSIMPEYILRAAQMRTMLNRSNREIGIRIIVSTDYNTMGTIEFRNYHEDTITIHYSAIYDNKMRATGDDTIDNNFIFSDTIDDVRAR